MGRHLLTPKVLVLGGGELAKWAHVPMYVSRREFMHFGTGTSTGGAVVRPDNGLIPLWSGGSIQ